MTRSRTVTLRGVASTIMLAELALPYELATGGERAHLPLKMPGRFWRNA